MQVLTRNGFKDFDGFICNGVKPVVDLGETYSNIKCTLDHRIKIDGVWVEASEINSTIIGEELVYDAVNVADGNEYITNANDSHNCLFLDEFAFVPSNHADEFFESVYPTISSGTKSKVSIFSTPKGMNHFYRMWQEATEGRMENGKLIKSDFVPISINWNDVPGRGNEFRERTIATIGLDSWNQEFECQFLGSVGSLVSSQVISNMHAAVPVSQSPNLKIYEQPRQDRVYLMTVDVARGAEGDYSVINVTDITELPYRQVAVYRNNKISYLLLPGTIYEIGKMYFDAYALIELNDNGESVADDLFYNYDYDNLLTTGGSGGKVVLGAWTNSKNGLRTTKSTKRQGCSLLKVLVENGQYIVNDYDTIEEMSNFVARGGSYEASPGTTDDIMMTLVIFAWAANQAYFQEICNTNFKQKYVTESYEQMMQELSPVGYFNGVEPDDGEIWNL